MATGQPGPSWQGEPPKTSRLSAQAFPTLKKYAGRGLMVVGTYALLGAASALWARQQRAKLEAVVSKAFILELDLETYAVVEKARPSPWALLLGEDYQLGLRPLLEGLRAAGRDDNCKGLVAFLGPRESFQGGLAQVQEVREAVHSFQAAASKRLQGTASGSRPVTTAFSASFGEAGTQGTIPYYFATAFDKIYVQPTGLVSPTGFESTMLFLRGMLEKLQIKPQFLTREEYKNAANMFTEKTLTAPQRESVESIMHDIADQVAEGIGTARKLDKETVMSILDTAPYFAQKASELGLIDGCKYKDEVVDLICKHISTADEAAQPASAQNDANNDKTNSTVKSNPVAKDDLQRKADPTAKADAEPKDLPRVTIQQYLSVLDARKHKMEMEMEAEEQKRAMRKKLRRDIASWMGWVQGRETGEDVEQADPDASDLGKLKESERKPHIALVTIGGPIMQGGPGTPPSPPSPSGTPPPRIESRKLGRELQAIAKMSSVKAVVLRINSPGGSALASDTLYQEVVKLKEAGKKVIVSMGDTAASGGYFISAPADKIVAMPGTLTGSIGVILGKFNVSGFLQELGVNVESVLVGKNASALSLFQDWTPEQLERAEGMIEGIYLDFLEKVARGRGMTMSETRKVAKGRVWTGKQAKAVGLVDELGGLITALEVAREAAGLSKEEDISTQVVEYPPQKLPPWLRFLRNMAAVNRATQTTSSLLQVFPAMAYLGPSTSISPCKDGINTQALGQPFGQSLEAEGLGRMQGGGLPPFLLLLQLPTPVRRSALSLLNFVPHTVGLQMLSLEAEAFSHVC